MSSTKPGCVDCGAAPVPHWLLFVDTVMNIYFGRALRILARPVLILFTPLVIRLTNISTHYLFALFAHFGWITFHTSYTSDHLDRLGIMYETAKVREIRMEFIRFLGRHKGQARAWLPRSKDGSSHGWWYFEHLPIPPWLEPSAARDIDNKEEFKKIFRKAGLRVPEGKPVVTASAARAVLRSIKSGRVIVKPLDGSRSRHTRVNLQDEESVARAVRSARVICPMAMVEEFIPGTIYRATAVDGKVQGVMELVRPVIIADGVHTADELRKMQNKRQEEIQGVAPIADDYLFALTLEHQDLTSSSIPPLGTKVLLAEFSERTNGGYFTDLTDEVPKENIAYLERGAKASGLPLVGFDVISRDIRDAHEPITFLEANTAPFIEIHHIPYEGTPRDVAGALWDLWFPTTSAQTQ